jgi:hypothetical protein
MATQFYLTLPSNSSMAYFQNNTVANFRVKFGRNHCLARAMGSRIDGTTLPTYVEHVKTWSATNFLV